jgi:hypothetical protein
MVVPGCDDRRITDQTGKREWLPGGEGDRVAPDGDSETLREIASVGGAEGRRCARAGARERVEAPAQPPGTARARFFPMAAAPSRLSPPRCLGVSLAYVPWPERRMAWVRCVSFSLHGATLGPRIAPEIRPRSPVQLAPNRVQGRRTWDVPETLRWDNAIARHDRISQCAVEPASTDDSRRLRSLFHD